jgi:hypothetical protein
MEDTIQSDQGGDAVQSDDQGSDNTEAQAYKQVEVKVAGKTYSSLEDMAKDYESLNKEFHKRNTTKPEPQVVRSDEQLDELGQIADLMMPELVKRGITTSDEMKLQTLLAFNPDLKDREQELRDLANLSHNRDKAYEDIVAHYGFKSSDKLNRAKMQGDLRGEPLSKEVPQGKSITDMTDAEYEAWRGSNIQNGR